MTNGSEEITGSDQRRHRRLGDSAEDQRCDRYPKLRPGELEREISQGGEDAPRRPITILRPSLHIAAVHGDEGELCSHEEPGEQDEQDDRAQPEVGTNGLAPGSRFAQG